MWFIWVLEMIILNGHLNYLIYKVGGIRKENGMSIFAKWELSPETKLYKCSNCGYEAKEDETKTIYHDNCPYCHFYMTEPRRDNPCQSTESK